MSVANVTQHFETPVTLSNATITTATAIDTTAATAIDTTAVTAIDTTAANAIDTIATTIDNIATAIDTTATTAIDATVAVDNVKTAATNNTVATVANTNSIVDTAGSVGGTVTITTATATITVDKSQLLGCVVYDVSVLKDVTHVMDIDGFIVSGEFYPKEIAIADIEYRVTRFDVRLPMDVTRLTVAQLDSVHYVSRNVHGMCFDDRVVFPRSMIDPCRVVEVVREFFEVERLHRRTDAIKVAFKGGQHERRLLESIGDVSFVNLEDYGCPRFDYLVKRYPRIYLLPSLANPYHERELNIPCDLHRVTTNKPTHCAVVECRAFVTWLNIALDKWITFFAHPIVVHRPTVHINRM